MKRLILVALAFSTLTACGRSSPGKKVSPTDAGVDAGVTGANVDAGPSCDTQSDPANCGACGHLCARGICANGLCGCTPDGGDCAPDEICGEGGLCRPSADPCADIQCSTGKVCRDGACQVIPCSSGANLCGPGETCSPDGVCRIPNCTDHTKNGTETDVDCGGTCTPCAGGKSCRFGADCTSGVCSGQICQIPTCADGVKNGGETDVDCGGPCLPCPIGRGCDGGADCTTTFCSANRCVSPTCTDGAKDGTETDVDCGGSNCLPCPAGKACSSSLDCGSGLACSDKVCTAGCIVSGVFVAPGTVNPANACQSCQPLASTSSWSNIANGTACDDGNACTSGETCQSGVCGSPAATVSCTALDQCHDIGRCDPATGTCSNPVKTDGAPCNDGNACTSGETCQAGTCGSPTFTASCPVPDQCHAAGTCNPVTGVCSNPDKPNGTTCDDGNACTTGETCQGGTCASPAVTYSCPTGCAPGGGCADGGTGLFVFYRDADNDGYGNPNVTAVAATAPPGYVADNTDCNDQNPNIHPGATEICNGIDDNCNGQIDEGVTKPFYRDADNDGYGDPNYPSMACAAPPGYVADNTDCDDTRAYVHPGATETCNGIDDNCNGQIDEGVIKTFYRDADNDGYGNPNDSITACVQPTGYVANNTDCNDANSSIHPGAAEVCNGIDDNCDGTVDGETADCTNTCGAGTQTCTAGVWGACNAPVITSVSTPLELKAQSTFNFSCLYVDSLLTIDPGVTLQVSNWIQVDYYGHIAAQPRSTINAGGDMTFYQEQYGSGLYATDMTLISGGTITIAPSSGWNLQGMSYGLPAYSGGGGAACNNTASLNQIGGGGGGARGGNGGQGGNCGTGPVVGLGIVGSGGTVALNGATGCSCACSSNAVGATPSGGAGGAVVSGGGGGANGGPGGAGGPGTYYSISTSYVGGPGGAAEGASQTEPQVGGGGGGGAGAVFLDNYGRQCPAAGGNGSGIIRVTANAFINQGMVDASGSQGQNSASYYAQPAGGGGGGGGGSLVFKVGKFTNSGVISVVGGNGGAGADGNNNATGNCTTAVFGGGGGGGGGKIYIVSPDGGTANIVTRGTLLFAGGAGGAAPPGSASCPGPAGSPGGAGWVNPP